MLISMALLLGVRYFWLMQLQMPPVSQVEGLAGGERLIVNLTSYGLRLPGERFWGYHRIGYGMPENGAYVAYFPTSTNAIEVGVCRALPGDTLWFDPMRRKMLPARTSPDAQALVIPGRSHAVEVTPHNARLLHFLLRHYEQRRVVIHENQRLSLDGKPVTRASVGQDYYCVETLPGCLAIIPHKALYGKVVGKLFARNKQNAFKFYQPMAEGD